MESRRRGSALRVAPTRARLDLGSGASGTSGSAPPASTSSPGPPSSTPPFPAPCSASATDTLEGSLDAALHDTIPLAARIGARGGGHAGGDVACARTRMIGVVVCERTLPQVTRARARGTRARGVSLAGDTMVGMGRTTPPLPEAAHCSICDVGMPAPSVPIAARSVKASSPEGQRALLARLPLLPRLGAVTLRALQAMTPQHNISSSGAPVQRHPTPNHTP
mmetsp:Transcript_49704/g.158746  ORF Transcript_49704/g.158746 Transcript_49704/m.158746 type:complete len:222 (+) Transcript_49704:237-902(+)